MRVTLVVKTLQEAAQQLRSSALIYFKPNAVFILFNTIKINKYVLTPMFRCWNKVQGKDKHIGTYLLTNIKQFLFKFTVMANDKQDEKSVFYYLIVF